MGNSYRSLIQLVTSAAALATIGCGSAGGPGGAPDADPNRPDADPPSCEDGTAILGKCQLTGGGDCTGVPTEQREFVALDPGDPVKMVTGPQGSKMFVLSVRTTGIYQGDPDNPASPENPDVTITLMLADQSEMALYRGRPYFAANEQDPTLLEVSGLFVIVEGSSADLVDKEITAVAELHDMNDEMRCGSVMFVATD